MKRESIYLLLLLISLLLLWDAKCSNNQSSTTTKPIKQTVEYSSKGIKVSEIVGPSAVQSKNTANKGTDQNKSSKNGKNGPNVDQSKNDSINAQLLAENEILIQRYRNANDSLKTALFNKSIQISDFEKTTDTTLYKLRQFGKVRGEILGLGFDIELKPQPCKKNWSVLAGAESTSNGLVKGKLFYYSKSGVMYFGGYGLDKTVSVGVAGRVFGD